MTELANERGVAPAQLALAWVLAKGDDIIPIPGTKSPQVSSPAQDVVAQPAAELHVGDFAQAATGARRRLARSPARGRSRGVSWLMRSSRSASWQPKRPLQPSINLSQDPVGQLANPLFECEAVDGGELGDVDDRVL